jgi:AcrR family transcriptional regulator
LTVDVKIRFPEDMVRGPRVVVAAAPEVATERGRRTRAALVRAARAIFERDGFLDSRIADITKRAKVAYGTFYTYFDSKEEIFGAVVAEVQTEQLGMGGAGEPKERSSDPVARIEAANRAYIDNYRKNAKVMAALEQLCTFSDEWRRVRLDLRRPFVSRASRAIARWQEAGWADPELDPWYAASALCNMVDRFMYVWMVLGEDCEEDEALATLTRLWAQSLRLTPEAKELADPKTKARSRPSSSPIRSRDGLRRGAD